MNFLRRDLPKPSFNLNFKSIRSNPLALVAVLLLVALIAIPTVLSSNTAQTNAPVAQLPQAGPVPAVPAIPAVSVSGVPSHSKLNGPSRNPFTPQATGSTGATGSSGTTGGSGTTGSSGTTGGSGTTGSSGTTGGTGSTGSSGTNPGTGTTTTPGTTPPPKPPVAELKPTQSYEVTLALTGQSGGLNTIPSLERLSAVPGRDHPLLVELGVLEGGKRVLFALRPGAVISGGGRCIPGPVDCQILSVGEGQVERLGARDQAGVTPIALFSVTSIVAQDHGSVAAADAARRAESAFGRGLLQLSTATALSLFKYEPSVGAIVDERNLTIGGN